MAGSGDETHVTVAPTKLTYFRDGPHEEVLGENSEHQTTDLKSLPGHEEAVDPKTLTWGPWFTHYATTSGSKVLNAIDYAGEGLANFFGITSPKYQLEIEEYERIQEEKKKIEEDSVGWVPTEREIPLVMNAPSQSDRPAPV